ncbi:MAG: response regulator transcription factor [Hydrogenophaga sp.]|uniref:response regulator transcription factor n=1 Tax=Hydrogenophaga sp. TaxID=1904254 RepID=UPI0025BF125E|nr:response regulator transcription factor [Hydrogenophaga sp.]MBU7574950.1 response regulator transcription factor [Hydrogenophaga sp.]
MWRVLIVEDDPEMRGFFESCVARSPALTLAGCVGTVAHAKDCLTRPGEGVDVLLTDLGLPDGSGLEVIRQARQTHPACETLVISMFGDEDNVLASIEAGALGYIHKDAAPEDIAQTILDMKAGGSPISPMIARRVLAKYTTRQAVVPPPAAAPPPVERPPLSRREQEVLGLIARGFSYQEIAVLQGVSVHTVQAHIKSLYSKLAVHSKMEAVFEATRMGMLPRHD